MKPLTKAQLIASLVDDGADTVRIVRESGMTITASFVMTRKVFDESIIKDILDNPESDVFKAELRGLARVDTDDKDRQTEGGRWRYDILVFKF